MALNPKAVEGRKKRQAQFTPVEVLHEIYEGMSEGAGKYGAFNWLENRIEISDYYDSTTRHLDDWWLGQDIDPDSGINHISKAITSLIVLRHAMMKGVYIDDRPHVKHPEHGRKK